MDPDLQALTAPLRRALEARPEIQEAYLFGSQGRGAPGPRSDVDVAIYVAPSSVLDVPGFGYAAEVSAELQAAVGRSDIDLVVLNEAPPLLYYRVLRDGLRLFSRDLAATTRRAGYALSRYYDYVPQLEKIRRAHQHARPRREGP